MRTVQRFLVALFAVLPESLHGQERAASPRARDTFLPVLGSAPETGLQFGGTWLRTFRRGPDSTTRVSRWQVTAIATAKHQRRASGSLDIWSAGNERRNRLSVEFTDYPLEFFAIGTDAPESASGTYTASGIDAQWLVQQKVARSTYVGAAVRFDGVRGREVDYADWDSSLGRPGVRTARQVKLQGMVIADTRDHQIAPRWGGFAQLTGSTASQSDADGVHTAFKLGADVRRYWTMPIGGVLTTQATAEALAGNHKWPDFIPAIGSDSIMRGYVRSRYRDDASVAAQAEYRTGFVRKLGAVVFAGASTLGDSPRGLGSHGVIGSAGVGLRYQLSSADRLRIRMDYARGKHGGALYLALGEAF